MSYCADISCDMDMGLLTFSADTSACCRLAGQILLKEPPSALLGWRPRLSWGSSFIATVFQMNEKEYRVLNL